MSSGRAGRTVVAGLLPAAALAVHIAVVLSIVSPSVLAGVDPVIDADYGFHYANAIEVVEHVRERGRVWGYDPRFLGGWPSGALLEVDNHPFALVVGLLGPRIGDGRAFNLTLFLLMATPPLLVGLGARLLGAPHAGTAVALAVFAQHLDLVPRNMTLAGLVVFVFGSSLAVLVTGVAHRYARRPSTGWLLALILALGGIAFVHPVAAVAATAAIAVAVLVGLGRRPLAVLGGFALASVAGLLANAVWMAPLLRFLPLKESTAGLFLRTSARRAWLDLIWSPDAGARALVIVTAAMGLVVLWRRQRGAAAVIAAGIAANAAFGYAGSHLGPIAELEPARFLAPMLAFAAVAAPAGLAAAFGGLRRGLSARAPMALVPALLTAAVIAVPAIRNPDYRFADRGLFSRQLGAALSEEEQAIVDWVAARDGWGRLLVDDTPAAPVSWDRIIPLLPHLAGRDLLNGHTPTVPVPHARTTLREGRLAGVHLDDWSDAELDAWFATYGVHWVLSGHPATVARLLAHPLVWRVERLGSVDAFAVGDGGPVLSGAAELEEAGVDRLVVSLTGDEPAVLKYRCLETLRVEGAGELGCVNVPGEPIGFLKVGGARGQRLVIVNGEL